MRKNCKRTDKVWQKTFKTFFLCTSNICTHRKNRYIYVEVFLIHARIFEPFFLPECFFTRFLLTVHILEVHYDFSYNFKCLYSSFYIIHSYYLVHATKACICRFFSVRTNILGSYRNCLATFAAEIFLFHNYALWRFFFILNFLIYFLTFLYVIYFFVFIYF